MKGVFDYRWKLKDAAFTKDKGTVFSCFANALFAGGVFGSAIEKAEKEIEEVEKIAYQE